MAKLKLPFKSRVRQHTGWMAKYPTKEVQCPICKEWFAYYEDYDLRGVKLHIRKWAGKEAMACMLGEIKKTPHLRFWNENTRIVGNIPKTREWTL
jgi:hypothetical protein